MGLEPAALEGVEQLAVVAAERCVLHLGRAELPLEGVEVRLERRVVDGAAEPEAFRPIFGDVVGQTPGDGGVDDGAPADAPALEERHEAAPLDRLRRRVAHEGAEGGHDVRPEVAGLHVGSLLDHRHRESEISQTVGRDRTGRARADDDEIERFVHGRSERRAVDDRSFGENLVLVQLTRRMTSLLGDAEVKERVATHDALAHAVGSDEEQRPERLEQQRELADDVHTAREEPEDYALACRSIEAAQGPRTQE